MRMRWDGAGKGRREGRFTLSGRCHLDQVLVAHTCWMGANVADK